MPRLDGQMQRRICRAIRRIEPRFRSRRRSRCSEQLDERYGARRRRAVQRQLLGRIERVDVRSTIQQQSPDLGPSLTSGVMKRRDAFAVPLRDVGAGAQQCSDEVDLAGGDWRISITSTDPA